MMFPKPQSGLGWPSIVVFNANSDGGAHLGKKIFWGAHTRPQNAPKTSQNGYFEAKSEWWCSFTGTMVKFSCDSILGHHLWVSSTSSLPVEDIEHVLTQCVGTSDTRKAKLPVLLSFARQLDLAASNVHGNLQHAIFNLSWQLPGRAMQLATCNLQRANLSFEQDWSCSVRLAGNLLAAAAGVEDSDWYRLEQGTKKHCYFHL